jgi:hypothetical protein
MNNFANKGDWYVIPNAPSRTSPSP